MGGVTLLNFSTSYVVWLLCEILLLSVTLGLTCVAYSFCVFVSDELRRGGQTNMYDFRVPPTLMFAWNVRL